MKSALLISTSITALLGLSACNSFDLDSGRSQILGADQRVLLVKHGPNGPYGPVADGAGGTAFVGGKGYLGSAANPVVCAEPSPDAISSIALSAAIKADVAGQGGGSASGSYGESAASIAARTAAVQVLRDVEYRACEALMNGVVGPQHYSQILSASAYTTIGLVAVDGLGQAKMANQPSISAQPAATEKPKAEEAKPADTAKKTEAATGAGKAKSTSVAFSITEGSSGSAPTGTSAQSKPAEGAGGSSSTGASTQTKADDGSSQSKSAPAPGEMARALCLTTIASPAGVDARLHAAMQAGNGSADTDYSNANASVHNAAANAKPDYTDVKELVETCMTGLAANTPAKSDTKSEPGASAPTKTAENSTPTKTAEKAGRKTIAQRQ